MAASECRVAGCPLRGGQVEADLIQQCRQDMAIRKVGCRGDVGPLAARLVGDKDLDPMVEQIPEFRVHLEPRAG